MPVAAGSMSARPAIRGATIRPPTSQVLTWRAPTRVARWPFSDLLGERNAVEGCEPDGSCVAGGGGRRRVERVSSGETTLELIRIFVLLVGAAALVTIDRKS